MFKNNFVVAVKVAGKVLREFDNSVYIPFGSEYSILLKNLDSRKVKVGVSIDGQDALDGAALVIDGRDEVDLTRFIKNGNFDRGNSFKFIEKTAKVEKHRSNRAEDGLITITYEFERPVPVVKSYYHGSMRLGGDGSYNPYGHTQYSTTSMGLSDGASLGSPMAAAAGDWYEGYAQASMDWSPSDRIEAAMEQPRGFLPKHTKSALGQPRAQNTSGVTAPGSINEQRFVEASPFYGDGKRETLTVQLHGDVGQDKQPVKEAVTVKKLKRCPMCGTNVRQTAKFCHECGSSVEEVL